MKNLLLIALLILSLASCTSEAQKHRDIITSMKFKIIAENQKMLDSSQYYTDLLQAEYPFITKETREKWESFSKRTLVYIEKSTKTNDSLTKVYNSIK